MEVKRLKSMKQTTGLKKRENFNRKIRYYHTGAADSEDEVTSLWRWECLASMSLCARRLYFLYNSLLCRKKRHPLNASPNSRRKSEHSASASSLQKSPASLTLIKRSFFAQGLKIYNSLLTWWVVRYPAGLSIPVQGSEITCGKLPLSVDKPTFPESKGERVSAAERQPPITLCHLNRQCFQGSSLERLGRWRYKLTCKHFTLSSCSYWHYCFASEFVTSPESRAPLEA